MSITLFELFEQIPESIHGRWLDGTNFRLQISQVTECFLLILSE